MWPARSTRRVKNKIKETIEDERKMREREGGEGREGEKRERERITRTTRRMAKRCDR